MSQRRCKALEGAMCVVSLLVLLPGLAAAQPAMVKDVNATLDTAFGLNAQAIAASGSTVFLSGTAEGKGVELFVSDGTEAGTLLVKDIWPGAAGSGITSFAVLGGVAYFAADDGVNGAELWRSDGTPAGTYMVKDISSGSGPSNPAFLTVMGGALYFRAFSTTAGQELWKSDGTEAGTVLVKDVCPGEPCSSSPWNLTAVGSTLFFSAYEGSSGNELWKSDGTTAGTVLVKDICAGAGCSGTPSSLANVGGTLFFNASETTNGTELWKSDGTPAGTVLVKDVCPGAGCNGNPTLLTNVGGTLFFAGWDPTNGTELWKSDGTPGGTARVKDICVGSGGSAPQSLLAIGSTLYFSANDCVNGRELWKSDGSELGTVLVKDFCPACSSNPTSLVDVGGTIYLAASGPEGTELWKSDGTTGGTALVKDVCPGDCSASPNLLTNVAGTLFFKIAWASGELWKSDGSDAGTVVVREFSSAASFPASFVEKDGALLFVASDGTSNREIFRSDGTPGGTAIVVDLGGGGGVGISGGLVKAGSTVFFSGLGGSTGAELWKTDGTDVGTVLVKDVCPGGCSSSPARLTPVGSTLFFVANDGTSGSELWKSDGTEPGTVMVADVCPGSCSANLQNLAAVGSTLFFTAQDGANGSELWKSDGTEAGTVLVKDICPGTCGSNSQVLTAVGGTLYFRASDGVYGWELWKSDGTAAGTVIVKEIRADGSSYPDFLTNVNGTLFFTAWNPDRELWKSDGTAAGTVLVKDICPGPCYSTPAGLVAVGDRLFFRATDGTSGMEPWVSDGTTLGTRMFTDIAPGSASSIPRPVRAVGSTLFFAANDGTSGEELWRSDGTTVGTSRVLDANPGAGHGLETDALVVGSRLLFNADDGTHGQELWTLGTADLSVTLTDSPDPVAQGAPLTYEATVTNAGTTGATGVRLAVTLPAEVTFSSVTPTGPICVHASGAVSCDLGPLGIGGSWLVTVQVTPNVGVTGPISATARATANEADPNGGNDVGTATTTVLGPQPVTNLQAQALSSSSIRLTWTDPQSTETGFRIERSTNGTSFTAFDQADLDDTTYTDSGRPAGTLLYYRVVSVQSGVGESAPSNVAAARTFPATAAKVCARQVNPWHAWARFPSVAPAGSQFGVVWADRKDQKDEEVLFQLVDAATGAKVGPAKAVTANDQMSRYPTVRYGGGRFGVLWYDHARDQSGAVIGFPSFAVLDAAGNKLRGDVRVHEADGVNFTGINNRIETALEWDGTGWGLVLHQNTSPTVTSNDLFYYRLDADGNRTLGPVHLAATSDDERDVAIAWNDSVFGLAWITDSPADQRVWFQRLQPDGTLLGSPALLWQSPAGGEVYYTHVLWDGTRWVVAFVDVGPGPDYPEFIDLRFVDASGAPVGSPVRVSHDFDPEYPPEEEWPIYDEMPTVLPKPGGGYVVLGTTYLNRDGRYEVVRYDTDVNGVRLGSRTIVSDDDTRHSVWPTAATNGTRVLAAYNDGRNGTQEVAAVLLDSSGGTAAGPVDLTTGHSAGDATGAMSSGSSAAVGVGDGFANVWTEPVSATSSQLFARTFDGAGNVAATLSPLSATAVAGRPGVVGVGDTFAVAFKDSSNAVRFARYDALGSPVVAEVVLATSQTGRTFAALDFSGEVYGVAWFKDQTISFLRVTPAGAPLGSPTSVALGSNPRNQPPQMKWTGSGWAVVWLHGNDLRFAFFGPDGTPLVGPLQLTSTGTLESPFHLVWNGAKVALAWAEDQGTGNLSDVWFTTLDLDGVLDYAPVAVVASPAPDGNPQLYWDVDRFRLVHSYGLYSILREIAVLPDGTVTGTPRFVSNRGGASSVAWNGATLGILWPQLQELYFQTTACLADENAPPCPSPTAVSDGSKVTLTWPAVSDPESGVFRHFVYRDGFFLAEPYGTTTSVVDGGFPPGATPTYEVRAMNAAYLASTGCTAVTPQADLSVTKSDGAATEVPGTSVSYTITVTNAGPSTVTSVTLNDPVPAAILSPVFTPSAGSYDPGTGAWTGLDLGPSESATLTLAGTVDPAARGSLVNTATVASRPGTADPNGANDSATDTDTLVPSADVSLTKSDAPDPVLQGQNLTYTLGVSNAGPSTATSVTLSDPLPSGVTFVSASAGCANASGSVTCALGTLAPGASSSVTIVVKPNAGTVGTVTNTATVSAAETDPDPPDNSATASTSVPGPSPARDLQAIPKSATTIDLRWTDPQGPETGFRLERSTDSVAWSTVDIVGPNATTYTDIGRTAATLYYHRVIALQAGVGEAPPSNTAAATTFATQAASLCGSQLTSFHGSASASTLAWNGTEWAAAWSDGRDGLRPEIWFQKLASATGAPAGSPVRVTTSGVGTGLPTLRWNGSTYGLVFREGTLRTDGQAASALRFALLDADGNELRGDVVIPHDHLGFRVGAGQETPLVWNGSGWGVFVATDAPGPPSQLRLLPLDADGDLVGGVVPLGATSGWQLFPSAAWSGTDYGVTWVELPTDALSYRVLFQRFTVAGSPLGSAQVAHERTGVTPAIGFAIQTSIVREGGSWVVGWVDPAAGPDDAEAIYLRRYGDDGLPTGSAVRLSNDLDPDFPPGDLVPIYDESPVLFPRPGGGVVALTACWLNTTMLYETCRYEADSSLVRVGSRTVLTPGDGRASARSRGATDGSRVLLTWPEGRSGATEVIDLLVDASGAVVAGPTDVTSAHAPGGFANPIAVALGSGFGGLFTESDASVTLLKGGFWNGAGTPLASAVTLSSRGPRTRPGAVAVGSTFAVAFKDFTNALVFSRFDQTGAPLISEAVLATSVGGRPGVGLAFSGERYGLAYFQGNNLSFRRVAPTGAAVGSAVSVTTATAPYGNGPQVAWVGSGWALVWEDGLDLFYALLAPDGTTSVPPIQVTFGSQQAQAWQLLWNGQELALAWHAYATPDPPGGEVYFTVLGLDGIKRFPPVVVGSGALDDMNPALYWDVDRFRIVMSGGDPYALREFAVKPDGTITSDARLYSLLAGQVGLAWNGATLGICWGAEGHMRFLTTACLADATPPGCVATSAVSDGTGTTVSWPAPSDPQSGIFRTSIYRDGQLLMQELPGGTSFVDGGVVPGTPHVYEVRPRNWALLEPSSCPSVTPSADLSVTKSDGATTEVPGTPVSYTITVTNAGPSAVTAVTLTDALPPALLSPLFTPSAGAYDPVTGAWTGLSLGATQSATLSLSATVASSATGTLVNTATVAPRGGVVADPDGSDDSATDTDTLVPSADLSVAKGGPSNVVRGQQVVYTLVVTNAGPSDAAGVSLADPTPPGLTFVGNAGDCATPFPCALGALPKGQSRSVTATFLVPSGYAGPDPIVNTATVSAATADPAGANDQASASTTVGWPVGSRRFHTLTPCRVLDTRDPVGPWGGPALSAGASRTFTVAGPCQVPVTAAAVSVNVTVTAPSAAGFLSLFPTGTPPAVVSTINYGPGQTRANNAIAVLGTSGSIDVLCGQAGGTAHFILDVNGYFE